MTLSIRQIAPESKACHDLGPDALATVIPRALILDALTSTGTLNKEKRERKLNLCSTVQLLIAQALFAEQSMTSLLHTLNYGRGLLSAEEPEAVATASAVSYRRRQLGVAPLQALMRTVCQPLATPQTPGAYRFGFRLMALDSTIESVPDSDANAMTFGRLKGRQGQSAFPQVRGTYLLECGTHAPIDAYFTPCRPSERHSAKVLLRSLRPEMLLLWDTGFHEYAYYQLVKVCGAQSLGRVPAGPSPQKIKRLSDGSWLIHLAPSDGKRKRAGEHLVLRMIEYTFTDPKLPGFQQTHRLITSLLDPQLAPALDLVCTYHERWEIEIAIDEIDTHQRLLAGTLRSKTPQGVMQELTATLIGYYGVRALMLQAAEHQEVDVDRLSFVHALRILQTAITTSQVLAAESLPQQGEYLLRQLAAVRLPERHLRINARVVRRKYSPFALKHPEHLHPSTFPKQQTFREVILVLVT